MRRCDYCKQKCKKTPFGSCVYLTKDLPDSLTIACAAPVSYSIVDPSLG